jgi:hypothetical protein
VVVNYGISYFRMNAVGPFKSFYLSFGSLCFYFYFNTSTKMGRFLNNIKNSISALRNKLIKPQTYIPVFIYDPGV